MLPAATTVALAGATPTAVGVNRAYFILPPSLTGEGRRIVLFTDGAPNCSLKATTAEGRFQLPDPNAIGEVEYHTERGTPTHVIAIDVPEGVFGGGPEGDALTDHRARLGELANAGGTDLLLVDDAASLDAALTALTEAFRSCRLRIHIDLLVYGFEIEVALDPTHPLPELTADACSAGERGYAYVDPWFDVVEFCGPACPEFQAQGFAYIEAPCFNGPE